MKDRDMKDGAADEDIWTEEGSNRCAEGEDGGGAGAKWYYLLSDVLLVSGFNFFWRFWLLLLLNHRVTLQIPKLKKSAQQLVRLPSGRRTEKNDRNKSIRHLFYAALTLLLFWTPIFVLTVKLMSDFLVSFFLN